MRERPGRLTLSLALALPAILSGATLTVTTTADSGAGSLRQAILDSNSSAGVLDTIAFAIPGAGVQTISPATGLPPISDPVVIDGTTQPGFAGAPLIELTASPQYTWAIRIDAGSSTVRALCINGGGTCVYILTNGGNTVEGCYIATDAAGTGIPGTNSSGILIQNSNDNTIGGNPDPARRTSSRRETAPRSRRTARIGRSSGGNYIGTDVTGTLELGNGSGIALANSTNGRIGGGGSGDRNVISGSSGDGVRLSGGSGHVVAGNLIGTDVTGTEAISNVFGIDTSGDATDFVIGGSLPGEGNLISGNGSAAGGIGIILNGTHDVTIQGNKFGTDITGTLPLPNSTAILVNTIQNTDILIGGVAARAM